MKDICQDPQLAARRFWQDVSDPVSGTTLKYPKGFAVINGERLAICRPAPAIGQHNREVYAEELGLSSSEIAQIQV